MLLEIGRWATVLSGQVRLVMCSYWRVGLYGCLYLGTPSWVVRNGIVHTKFIHEMGGHHVQFVVADCCMQLQ